MKTRDPVVGFVRKLLLLVLIVGWSGQRTEASEAPQTPESQQRHDRIVQDMLADNRANGSGLNAVPFPNLKDSLHLEIRDALAREGKLGEGFGTVCEYFGVYLVNIAVPRDNRRCSYFYSPTNHHVMDAKEERAFAFYGGERGALATNAVKLVQHLLAVHPYEAFVVSDWRAIPHTRHARRNPQQPFEALLQSKGISLHPPLMLALNEELDDDGYIGYSECSVFAYFPLGGQLFRYEVQCKRGRIVKVRRALLGEGVGDGWEIM